MILLMLVCAGAAEAAGKIVPQPTAPVELTHYTFTFVDPDGNPLPGVMLSVCSDTFCAMAVSGEDGVAVFEGEPAVYEVHVLKAPEGYFLDTEQVYETAEVYANMDFAAEKISEK